MNSVTSKILICLIVLFSANSYSQQGNTMIGSWEVVTIGEKMLTEKNKPTLMFLEDGKIAGSTGCNKYNATFTQTNDELDISRVVSTRRACAQDSVMMQEVAFLNAIRTASQLEYHNGSEIKLVNQDKALNIVLKKLDE